MEIVVMATVKVIVQLNVNLLYLVTHCFFKTKKGSFSSYVNKEESEPCGV